MILTGRTNEFDVAVLTYVRVWQIEQCASRMIYITEAGNIYNLFDLNG